MAARSPFRFCPACGEALEERMAFGRMRPVCPGCGRVHFLEPKVAVAVLVTQGENVLLVQRDNEPAQGLWSLPGGYVDAGEDPLQAAVRECCEETGLTIDIRGLLDVLHADGEAGADIVIVYEGEEVGGTLKAGDDARTVGFHPRNDLPPLAFTATRRALEHGQ